MSFLPATYEPPATSNYMRFTEGENRFRILPSGGDDDCITGWEAWVTDGKGRKPVRAATDDELKKKIGTQQTDDDSRSKHFWAMKVWNYAGAQVQVLEITQATIQREIMGLIKDPDYGDPTGYDIKVIRSGSGLDTEYSVRPAPKSALPPDIAAAAAGVTAKLDALYDGDDPFADAAPQAPAQETTTNRYQGLLKLRKTQGGKRGLHIGERWFAVAKESVWAVSAAMEGKEVVVTHGAGEYPEASGLMYPGQNVSQILEEDDIPF